MNAAIKGFIDQGTRPDKFAHLAAARTALRAINAYGSEIGWKRQPESGTSERGFTTASSTDLIGTNLILSGNNDLALQALSPGAPEIFIGGVPFSGSPIVQVALPLHYVFGESTVHVLDANIVHMGTNTDPAFYAPARTPEPKDTIVAELEVLLAAGYSADDIEAEDPVASSMEAASVQYGALAVEAAESLLKSGSYSVAIQERLIRALGFMRESSAAHAASDLLAHALRSADVRIRDVAVAAMSLGADPDRAVRELRDAAQVESVEMLRSAMLQTAEQLETWSRRRAVIAKNRTKEMAAR